MLTPTHERKKFASQADPALLEKLHQIAYAEGRQFQAVLEDAFRLYIETKDDKKPRAAIMAHFQASLEKNRKLGKLLAE